MLLQACKSESKLPTVGEDGLDLRLVPLLQLDDGSSRECGEHGDGRRIEFQALGAVMGALGCVWVTTSQDIRREGSCLVIVLQPRDTSGWRSGPPMQAAA
jgi:hypothetical protein